MTALQNVQGAGSPRNLESSAHRLDFGEFIVTKVGLQFREFRDLFQSTDINQGDWILEKLYSGLPLGPPGSPVGSIPNEIEDVLLLLRLYRVGDVSFVKLAIITPNGLPLIQFPYRAINDLNSYSLLQFRIEPRECTAWEVFAEEIRTSQSWRSDWFSIARRFFLSGGAKPFNPAWDDVDRIVDYCTALEAVLAPERDYSTSRVRHRAAELLAPGHSDKNKAIATLVRALYDLRSRIVHGTSLDGDARSWLEQNSQEIESQVRRILAAAVQQLPPLEEERREALAGLYDPSDEHRAEFAVQKFREISDPASRQRAAAEIAKLAER